MKLALTWEEEQCQLSEHKEFGSEGNVGVIEDSYHITLGLGWDYNTTLIIGTIVP